MKRKVSCPTLCPFCVPWYFLEDDSHLFFHCSYARKIWKYTVYDPQSLTLNASSMYDVWFKLALLSATVYNIFLELFATITFQIWNSHYSLVFERSHSIPVDILLRVQVLLDDFHAPNALPLQYFQGRVPSPPSPPWQHPPKGFTKLTMMLASRIVLWRPV